MKTGENGSLDSGRDTFRQLEEIAAFGVGRLEAINLTRLHNPPAIAAFSDQCS